MFMEIGIFRVLTLDFVFFTMLILEFDLEIPFSYYMYFIFYSQSVGFGLADSN